MAKLKNFILKSSIDSFKYRIDLSLVKVLDPNLLDSLITQTVNSATGEVINSKELKLNSLKPQFDSYHIHFAINDLFGVKYLVILINSKLLEKSYLDGIHRDNIELIYNKIISANVVSISFKDFMEYGLVSDIDVKKDVELDVNSFKDVIKKLYTATKPTKESKYGVKKFNKETNLGIQWNERENATAKHPFLKLYHKEIESRHGANKEYFYNHINLADTDNIVRCEATIKNTKELEMYGIKGNRLIDLMNTSNETLTKVIEYALDLNVEPRLKKAKIKAGMNMNNQLHYISLCNMIQNQDRPFQSALDWILSQFNDMLDKNNATNKARAKKLLTAIYEEHINGKISEVKSTKINSFFDNIGWL